MTTHVPLGSQGWTVEEPISCPQQRGWEKEKEGRRDGSEKGKKRKKRRVRHEEFEKSFKIGENMNINNAVRAGQIFQSQVVT